MSIGSGVMPGGVAPFRAEPLNAGGVAGAAPPRPRPPTNCRFGPIAWKSRASTTGAPRPTLVVAGVWAATVAPWFSVATIATISATPTPATAVHARLLMRLLRVSPANEQPGSLAPAHRPAM